MDKGPYNKNDSVENLDCQHHFLSSCSIWNTGI